MNILIMCLVANAILQGLYLYKIRVKQKQITESYELFIKNVLSAVVPKTPKGNN